MKKFVSWSCILSGTFAHYMQDIATISSHIVTSRGYSQVEWCVPNDYLPWDHRYGCGQFEAGTMVALVQALNDGAEELKRRSPNPISLNAGCELFIAFVTLFPHGSDVSVLITRLCLSLRCSSYYVKNFAELKKELEQQGRRYAAEAISFRDKIAELTLGFIKDDSVVSAQECPCVDADQPIYVDPYTFSLTCGSQGIAARSQDEAHFGLRDGISTEGTWVMSMTFSD